jgi:hypothetical protein
MGHMFQRVTVVQDGLVLPRLATIIPQNGVKSLFTIASGVIRIMGLFGVVTTVIAGGANNTKFQFKPTGQTAVDLCAVADIGTSPLAVGQMIGVVGPVATALATGWGVPGPSQSFLVGPGTIDLNCAASAGTGAFRFVLRYQQVDPSAYVQIA